MHRLRNVLSLLLIAAMLLGILSGCKVVDIPEDAWFRSSSSSSSSFVEELVELDSAVPVEDGTILYQDLLDGARIYVAQNPDSTDSLIYESASGERTRLYVSPRKRQILYPLFSDNGSQVAFMLIGVGAQIGSDAYLGELCTISVSGGDAAVHGLYVRSYPDNPRGYVWHSEDTLFISSAVLSTGDQNDCIGYFNITNDEMNNIVGGEHPVDYARQGTVSPDGKLIAYSGFYANNSKYAHCIFDTETGETSYWYDKGSSGMSDTLSEMTYNPFIDNERILKMRTYSMRLDADGNIIYDDTPTVEEELSSEPETSGEESSQPEESSAVNETEIVPGEESGAEESSAEASEQEEQKILVNSIFTFDVLTGEQVLLVEHAYRPYLSKDRTKVYFHLTIYSPLTDGTNLSRRVFCYEFATGEITEVTESLGVTSSYDVILLEQRLNGYEG